MENLLNGIGPSQPFEEDIETDSGYSNILCPEVASLQNSEFISASIQRVFATTP
ncbi:hypothetical protein ANO14919_064730 [Xylariales sp. No.14919]|nr:hypothetical protein ANO14919_064730 [Xylariales sp. No.14919]